MSANIGWLFYKDYFRNINWYSIDENTISNKVDNIINTSITKIEDEPLGNIHFKATTTYPGLILGSGYLHELPSIEGQAILGFDFDYTSGLPIIRGSSIKGVIRSAFRHIEYIKEIINKDIDIKALEEEIFENSDIFFDAVIISGGKILADDYLAPHGDDPLKNPIPLRFIKVAPNITFRFDFELKEGIISKETKSKLFQTILEDLGVGSKTNVGYGKFEEFSPFKTKAEEEQEKIELELKKEQEKQKREDEAKRVQEEKEKKAQGIDNLRSCKDIKTAMKIINESLGKKPNPTSEQKSIIENFWKKYSKQATKSEIKFFKKFGIN